MLNLPLLLAQAAPADIEDLKAVAKDSSPRLFGTDVNILLAVLLGLAAILFFWAFFLRRRPEHVRGSLVLERVDKHSRDEHGSSGRRKRRKRRADHPSNWGRNPTLSETGGLPPERPEEPEQPTSASPAPPSAK